MTPSYLALRAELRRRREAAGFSRDTIVPRLVELGAPERLCDKERIRFIEARVSSNPPNDFTELRYLARAAGMPWTEALALIGAWPPVEG